MKVLLRLFYSLSILLISIVPLKAIPQFSLISGNRCNSCHVNNQGAGIRNDLGWYSYRDVGAIQPDDLGLGSIWGFQDSLRNAIGSKANIGFDSRIQFVRSRNPEAESSIIPMQFSLYGSYAFTPWITAEGSYNVGPIKYRGQQSATASVIVQPSLEYPSLRIGFFQPSIGVRNDDHTTMNRQIAGGWLNEYMLTPYSQMTLIAPNFSALGAEMQYESVHWLSVSAGVFSNSTLNQNAVSYSNKTSTAISLRAVVWPRFFDNTVNTYLGSSMLVNGDFSMMNYFMGIGITDVASLSVDLVESTLNHNKSTEVPLKSGSFVSSNSKTISSELMLQAYTWLFPFVRGEYAELDYEYDTKIMIRQYVLGMQIMPLPNIEIRPEYRIFDTELPGYIGRWGAQLHIYY